MRRIHKSRVGFSHATQRNATHSGSDSHADSDSDVDVRMWMWMWMMWLWILGAVRIVSRSAPRD
jgi:hypothetical protein